MNLKIILSLGNGYYNGKKLMDFKSQFGQDEYLYNNYFKNVNNGIYIDIGAYDGITGSNTYIFDHLGWTGFCIEPNKNVYKKLQTNRISCNIEPVTLPRNRNRLFFAILFAVVI